MIEIKKLNWMRYINGLGLKCGKYHLNALENWKFLQWPERPRSTARMHRRPWLSMLARTFHLDRYVLWWAGYWQSLRVTVDCNFAKDDLTFRGLTMFENELTVQSSWIDNLEPTVDLGVSAGIRAFSWAIRVIYCRLFKLLFLLQNSHLWSNRKSENGFLAKEKARH